MGAFTLNGKVIIIAGYLASGKSTFARQLSAEISVPYLVKDTFKTALCESVVISNREDSSLYSAVTFDGMMYVTERLIETGHPIIIEGNFVPKGMIKVDEAGVISTLLEKYSCQSLTYRFMGDTQTLYERYIEREKSPDRGAANRDFTEVPFDKFNRYCRNLDDFCVGGKIVDIDTTDFKNVDFKSHFETARLFIGSNGDLSATLCKAKPPAIL